MIKVIITGPSKNGYFPYRVDWWFEGRPQLTGLSPAPLLDACRQLQQMGLMDSTVVGLFDEDKYQDTWRLRTTVGYGARHTVRETPRRGPEFVPYRPFPDRDISVTGSPPSDFDGDPLVGIGPEPKIDNGETANVAPIATPVEEPPEPRKHPKHPAGKGRAHAEPDKPEPPHRKRKRAGSGARRGSR